LQSNTESTFDAASGRDLQGSLNNK